MIRGLVLLLLPAFVNPLQAGISKTILQAYLDSVAALPAYQQAAISFCLVNTQTQQVAFSYHADTLLAPASTLKTLTTAAALQQLGPEFRYKTRITFQGKISKGKARGILKVYGSGDPSLGSDRFATHTPERILQQIQTGLRRMGIRTFTGSVIEGKSVFTDTPIHTSWLPEDVGNYYGAGVYSLNWKENQFKIQLGATQGKYTAWCNDGPIDAGQDICFEIQQRPNAGPEDVYAYLDKGRPCAYTLRGFLSAMHDTQRVTLKLARLQPGRDFMTEIKEKLKETFQYQEEESMLTKEPERTVCTIVSPPLYQLTEVCNQKSINLYAEAFCKTMAIQKKQPGTWPFGLQQMMHWIRSLVKSSAGTTLLDASGLSPGNRMNTRTLALGLQSFKRYPWFKRYYQGLPVINGFKMKSGYIGGTRAYAGYHTDTQGKVYSFAFIIQGYQTTPQEVKQRMFQFLDLLKQ